MMMGAAIAVAAGCAGEVVVPGGNTESSSGAGAGSSDATTGSGAGTTGSGAGSTGAGAGSTGSGPSGCSGLANACAAGAKEKLFNILQECEMFTGECCPCVDVKLLVDDDGCALSVSSSSAALDLLTCVSEKVANFIWPCAANQSVAASDNCGG